MSQGRSDLVRALCLTGFYALAALVITFPFISSGGTLLPGDEALCESYMQPWSFWLIYHSVLEHHTFPVHTDLVFFPRGGSFFPQEVVNAFLASPVWLVTKSVAAALNASLFLNIFLGGLFAWLLLRHLTKDGWASLVGSVVYVTCPLLISFMRTGYLQGTNMVWLPLAVLAFLRAVERPGTARALAASACFVLLCLANFYAGVAGLFFLLFYLAWHGPGMVKRGETPALKTIALFLALAGAGCAALFIYVGRTFHADPLIVLNRALSSDVLLRFSNPDLVRFFLPVGRHDLTRLIESYYLGMSVLAFAVFPAFRGGLRGERRFWLFLVFFQLVLAAGPYLMVDGLFVMAGGKPLRLPFYWLFTHLPFFDIVRHPGRLMSLVYLALAALVALNFRALDLSGGRRAWAALALGGLFAAEYLFIAPVIFPLPVVSARCPEYCSFLKTRDGDFAVLHLPFLNEFNREDVYKYWQTFHGKKLGNGFMGALPGELRAVPLVNALWYWEQERRSYEPLSPALLRRSREELARLGFRYVVMDKALLKPWDSQTVPLLTSALGKPLDFKDGLVFSTSPRAR